MTELDCIKEYTGSPEVAARLLRMAKGIMKYVYLVGVGLEMTAYKISKYTDRMDRSVNFDVDSKLDCGWNVRCYY